MTYEHSFEDVTGRGIGLFMCEYCDCYRGDEKSKLPCPKRAEYLDRKLREEYQKEKDEWRRLVEKEARKKYLIEKFGPIT